MTRDEIHTALEAIKSALHSAFPEHVARLQQFDSHVATVGMVVDHVHDEAEKGVPAQ